MAFQQNMMKKYILPLLLTMFVIVAPITVSQASSLEVSNTADFSSSSLDFAAGQTIFVRVQTSLPSDKSVLNLRDNKYNLLNTFKFARDGNYYSAVIPAPYQVGYYSLEAQIESESSSATSVKTIKVGNPSSANVSVHVNNKTGGQSLRVLGETESDKVDSVDKSTPSPSPEASGVDAAHSSNSESTNGGLFSVVAVIFKEVIDFFWPFD